MMPILNGKHLLILFIVGCSVFANSLFNQFIGDDEVKITHSTFFRDLNNVPRLFDRSHLSRPGDLFEEQTDYDSSGEVSYRPVTSLTFFADYHFWKLNPFGYHAVSVLLHLLNVFLLYFIALRIFEDEKAALWAAFIFCVHPIQSESVSFISHRNDLMACFFALLSFLIYLKYYDRRSTLLLCSSVLFYFLAIFSKESAIVLPAILFSYDYFVRRQKLHQLPWLHYAFFSLTGIFYIYCYLVLFPNTQFHSIRLLNVDIYHHALTVMMILGMYLQDFLVPVTVHHVVPFYYPSATDLSNYPAVINYGLVVLLLILMSWSALKNKKLFFSLLWFAFAWIPISNILPLVNPVAHRYLYLPAVGLALASSWVISRLPAIHWREKTFNLQLMLMMIFLASSAITTISLNYAAKNNFTMAYQFMKDYPRNSKGYIIMGVMYAYEGYCDEAVPLLLKARDLGTADPRVDKWLKKCASVEALEDIHQ